MKNEQPNPWQFARLREMRRLMAFIAGPVGPQHTFWDDISEIDSATGFGGSRRLDMSIPDLIAYLEQRLKD